MTEGRAIRRRLLLIAGLGTLCGLAAAASPRPSAEPAEAGKALNLLLITIDTLRPDRLSCYGSSHLKTDTIDGLAASGVVFLRAFAQTTTTLPSHANILLGTDPLGHGVHDNAGFTVSGVNLSLAEFLKAKGYATGAFVGGFPLDSRFGLDQGFDIYDDAYESRGSRKQTYRERKAGAVVAKALEWVSGQTAPWFLWVHCFDPHSPYEPPEPFRSRYQDRLYDGEVASVDAALEPLLRRFSGTDGLSNTVIVLTGDHGEALGEHGEETHGYLAYNATLWIPLILRAPGLKPGRVDQTVVHTDLFPTVCNLLGIRPPSGLQGVSLLAAINGKKLPPRTLYFESLYPYYSRGWAPICGFLRGPKKFIDSPIPELYDISKDFGELKNIVTAGNIRTLKDTMASVIGDRSPLTGREEQGTVDPRTLEKLQSLGYISSPQVSRKKTFGPEDDVKSLLPFHNRVVKAQDLYESGKRKEGLELMRSVLVERPNLDITYTTLAQIYAREGRILDALAVMKSGAEALPTRLKIVSGYIHFLNEAGRYDDVIRLLAADGRFPFENIPESWNDLGVAYMRKGDFDKALEAFHKAIALDDGNSIVYRNLGNLHFAISERGKNPTAFKTSLDFYRRAIEINPDDPSSYNGMGFALLQGGRPDEALPLFERALALAPGYSSALYNLGLALFESGNPEKALEILVRFKERYGRGLSPAQAGALDDLIGQCRSKIRSGSPRPG